MAKETRKDFLIRKVIEREANPPDEMQDLRSWFYDLVPDVVAWAKEQGVDIEQYNATHKQSFATAVYKDLSAVVSEMVLNHETTYSALRLVEESREKLEDFSPDFDFEIWFEKDGLMKVIKPVARFGIDTSLMSSKGFQSTNVLEKSQSRINIADVKRIFVLSDHDPSGREIARDLQRRADRLGLDVRFKRIGIDPDDIPEERRALRLLEINWKDTRAQRFFEEWGEECYEINAISNKELRRLILDRLEEEGIDFSELPEKRLDEDRHRLAEDITDSLLDDLKTRVEEYCYDLIVEYDKRSITVEDLTRAVVENFDPLSWETREVQGMITRVRKEAREEFGIET